MEFYMAPNLYSKVTKAEQGCHFNMWPSEVKMTNSNWNIPGWCGLAFIAEEFRLVRFCYFGFLFQFW